MADFTPPPALPAGERRAAEALLTRALGEPAEVQAAEPLWDRGHVFRLHLTSGRAAILKRKRREWSIGAQLFGDELAALDYLNEMPVPVAPRLLGADARAAIAMLDRLTERWAGIRIPGLPVPRAGRLGPGARCPAGGSPSRDRPRRLPGEEVVARAEVTDT